MITQKELKTILHYDPETGVFTRLQKNGRRYKIGQEAGCLSRGYILIRVLDTLYRAHRLAWLYVHGSLPEFIDHINGIKDDNRISNLRPATRAQNTYNIAEPANNSSGIKGVYWMPRNKKWRSKAKLNGKFFHLGVFNSKEEAANAYREFALANHGDFARITFES